ncbi:MAG: hypothetical protein JXR77_04425, partial [Lentisphaeria bacterium]|nr:hypothetical protein [Lentisphaeria bacterium]
LPDPCPEGTVPASWCPTGAPYYQAQISRTGDFSDAVSSPILTDTSYTFTDVPPGPVCARARAGIYSGPGPEQWLQTAEADFAVDALVCTHTLPVGDGAVGLGGGGGDVRTELFGARNYDSGIMDWYRHGNWFTCDEDRSLIEIRQYLDVPPGEALVLFVALGDPSAGPPANVFESAPLPGVGEGWYNVSCAVPLEAGSDYVIGVMCSNGLIWDDDEVVQAQPSWGVFRGSLWEPFGTSIYQFYQELVTTGSGGGAVREEIFGAASYGADWDEPYELGFGNAFACHETRTLVEVRQFLGIPPGEAVTLFVGAGDPENPTWLQYLGTLPGAGQQWYSVPCDVLLEAGETYVIGVGLSQGTTWDDDGSVGADPSWGTFLGSAWTMGPMPPTGPLAGSQEARPPADDLAPWQFYQVLVTEGAGGVCTDGTVMTPALTVPMAALGGILQYTFDTPAGTSLTVDVLQQGPIVYPAIPSGSDILAFCAPGSEFALRANLATLDPAVTPLLLDWSVTWLYAEDQYAWTDWSAPVCGTVAGADPTITAVIPTPAVACEPLALQGVDFPTVLDGVLLDGPAPIPLNGIPEVNAAGTYLSGVSIPPGTPPGLYPVLFDVPSEGLVPVLGEGVLVAEGVFVVSEPIDNVAIDGSHPGITDYSIVGTGPVTLIAPWQVGPFYFMGWYDAAGTLLTYSATASFLLEEEDMVVAAYDDTIMDFYAGGPLGNDDYPGTSPAAPAAHPQTLLDRYTGWIGKTIHVAAGEYPGPLTLSPQANGIRLSGAGDGDDPTTDTLVVGVGHAPALVIQAGGEGCIPLTIERIRFTGGPGGTLPAGLDFGNDTEISDPPPPTPLCVVIIHAPPGGTLADLLLRNCTVLAANHSVGLLVTGQDDLSVVAGLLLDGCHLLGPSMAAMAIAEVNLTGFGTTGTDRWTLMNGGQAAGLYLHGGACLFDDFPLRRTAFFGNGAFDILLEETWVTVDALEDVLFCEALDLAAIEERVWHIHDDPEIGEVLFGIPSGLADNLICY